MQITKEQLDRFLKGVCTQEEAAEIAAYLDEHPAALSVYLGKDWEGAETDTVLRAGLSEEMYDHISRHTFRKGRTVGVRTWIGAAAAAALVSVLVTCGIFQKNSSRPAMLASLPPTVSTADTSWERHYNSGHKKDTVLLPDGSFVYLYQHSGIRFRHQQRMVYLEGKASFSVTKNPHAPFIVYAGATATTVLGTCFNIDQTPGKVIVTLYEGKVMVKAASLEKVVMQPGQQLTFNTTTSTVSVTEKHTVQEMPQLADVADALTFNNTPMQDVLDQLSRHYHTSIVYDVHSMKQRYFTGSVLPSDSLQTILTVISQMHELQISQRQDTVIVSKKQH